MTNISVDKVVNFTNQGTSYILCASVLEERPVYLRLDFVIDSSVS
jgi:hypothetical protein